MTANDVKTNGSNKNDNDNDNDKNGNDDYPVRYFVSATPSQKGNFTTKRLKGGMGFFFF
jgi:hypothetical protein